MNKLIFGCGYLGSRVARRWRDAGSAVHVVTRSADRAAEFATQGYQPIVADVNANVNEASSLVDLPTADTVLVAIGYDRSERHTIGQVYVDGLRHILAALPAATGRVITISSTGVYGQTDAQWVDETTPCSPTRAGGVACLAAERVLAAHAFFPRSVILRLAGIYGPGRVPYLARLEAGEPIPAVAEGLVNLIHVDDAVTAILAAAAATNLPATYCVSDGNPTERSAYYAEVARLIGAAPPRFVVPDTDLHAVERATSSKRVRNTRLLADLSLQLAYPTYREGLAAILADR